MLNCIASNTSCAAANFAVQVYRAGTSEGSGTVEQGSAPPCTILDPETEDIGLIGLATKQSLQTL